MRLLKTAFWLSLAGGLALACSSGGGGDAGGDFGARYCELFAPCCADVGLSGDQRGCKLLFGASASKNAAAAEACIAEYEVYAQEADWCENFAKYPRPPSCDIAYPQGGSGGSGGGNSGSTQPGQACDFSDECAANSKGSVDCYHEFETDKDFCQVRVSAGAGQSCAATVDGNSTYFSDVPVGASEINYCDYEQGVNCENGVCVALSALGEPCAESKSCASEAHYCSGTCKERLPPGSDCSETYRACDDQGYCTLNRTCEPRRADGADCSSYDECLSGYCTDDSVCGVYDPNFGPFALLLLCN